MSEHCISAVLTPYHESLHWAERRELSVIDIEIWTGRDASWLRKALRMSQRDFAAHLGISDRTVAKWDSRGLGIRPRDEYQRVLDTALAQAPVDVQQRFQAQRGNSVPAFPNNGDIAVGSRASASAEARPLNWPSAADGIDTVDFYEHLMVDYAAFDNSAGPKPVVDVITRHAIALVDQLAETHGDSWTNMARVAARYAEFAGWLHQDAGDPKCAARWTETALSIAHASGDEGMVAYTLMRRSNQTAEQDQVGMAIGLADAALNVIGSRTPRIRALGYRQKAAGLALLGDSSGCIDALAHAQDEIASDPDWNPLTGYCTVHYLEAEAALCFLRLDRADKAVELLTPAVATWPNGYVRDRGFYQAHLAEALALSGEVETAREQAQQAAALVATCGSRRTAVQVHRVPAVLDIRDEHRAAAGLRRELATVMV